MLTGLICWQLTIAQIVACSSATPTPAASHAAVRPLPVVPVVLGSVHSDAKCRNPTIVPWAKEVGGKVADVYKADSIPWCGLFMAVVAKRAGKEIPKHPLWALSWSAFGAKSPAAALGDVLVFVRNGGGHVGLYVGEDASAFHVLGGNQSDRVCITRVSKRRLYGARRPLYRVQPSNVRPIHLEATGALSLNEA